MTSSIGHVPGDKWEFDASVTDVFDDMLTRSIPQLETMRSATRRLASSFFKPQTSIYDLGCSRGDVLWSMFNEFGGQAMYVGVEISKPMIDACRDRFRSLIECGVITLRHHDMRDGLEVHNASIVASVLTLQFVPINYRQAIISSVYDGLRNGGAFLFVEKVLGASAELDSAMIRHYHELKARNGYPEDEIERKRLALEGVLVPLSVAANIDLLSMAGFRHIDCYWRWMNFAGFVAVKS